MDPVDVEKVASRLWVKWREGREKSIEWQDWALGSQPLPTVPDTASAEYTALQRKAITPWLGLLVQSLAQALIVEGYRPSTADEENRLWRVWQANRMDAGQVAVYEAALTTGVSYVAVLPTGAPRARAVPMLDGVPVPEWRPFSSAEMTAFYESARDEWPAFALAAEPVASWEHENIGEPQKWRLTLFDERQVYFLEVNGSEPMMLDEEPRQHGHGVCPVVRFVNRQTITGRALGEVEPYVAVASRVDQDVLDRLIVQRFASWRTRWATGLVAAGSEDEQRAQALTLLVSDILTSDSVDTKFGSLPETPLDGHLRAPMEDVRMLAAVSQTPPTILTGDLTNISAEALAAIEAAYNRKVEQRKVAFGESWEQVFNLTAVLMEGAEADESAQVRWRDMESRSLAQMADAFGKLASQLEIPVEVLWDKVPFLTDQDRERSAELRDQASADAMLSQIAASLEPVGPEPAAEVA